jgi:hypothetical protein
MIGFRCQRRLTQGPAVELADRRHSLRRCMVTGMRSAYVLVWCAVGSAVERAWSKVRRQERPENPTFDSIMTATPSKPYLTGGDLQGSEQGGAVAVVVRHTAQVDVPCREGSVVVGIVHAGRTGR